MKILVVTNFYPPHHVGGYELGVNSYIRKPAEFAAFTQIMSQLQRYWLVTNTAPPV